MSRRGRRQRGARVRRPSVSISVSRSIGHRRPLRRRRPRSVPSCLPCLTLSLRRLGDRILFFKKNISVGYRQTNRTAPVKYPRHKMSSGIQMRGWHTIAVRRTLILVIENIHFISLKQNIPDIIGTRCMSRERGREGGGGREREVS